MTRFEYINKNLPEIKEGVKLGIISTSILNHYAIYCRYDFYRKQGNNNNISVFYTCEDFNITEATVYRIKKEMNQ